MMKYSEFYELHDACNAELEEFQKDWDVAKAKEKAADKNHKYWASVETAQAKLIYLTAFAVYMDFLKNTVAEP